MKPGHSLGINIHEDHLEEESNLIVRVVGNIMVLWSRYEPECLILKVFDLEVKSVALCGRAKCVKLITFCCKFS